MSQGVHVVAPVALFVRLPGKHSWHWSVCGVGANLPRGQTVHSRPPSTYWPCSHVSHESRARFENFPLAQAEHETEPSFSAMKPGSQLVQLRGQGGAEALEKRPVEQGEHAPSFR